MSRRAKVCQGNTAVAVAYIRASKDEQHLSPDAQRASIEAWAAREGVQVASWHVDQGVCSVTPLDERAGLMAALGAVQGQGAGVLVVARRDRLARDVVLAAALERLATGAGAVIVSADGVGNGDGPEAALMRSIVDAFAQYERALIRARTKAALAVKKAKGQRVSRHIPYGYQLGTDGVHLAPIEAEQATISAARQLRASGLSLAAVARELASRGLHSRTGAPFVDTQISRML